MESPDALKRIIGQQMTDELLDALDQLFPEKTPELTDSIDQVRYASGQRSVIRFLRGLING
ncbi:MAG: hypothetical protein FJ211_09195 [Ignavibacteria bacterium]|nr:hypothetical protein [Ignavibacteria bacterium]